MCRFFGILAVLVMVCPCATQLSAEEKQSSHSYYPLEVGNQWHFQLDAGTGVKTKLINRIAEIETIDGVELARLETLTNGNVVATEHLRKTSEGIFRHRYNGAKIVPPICLLKFPVKDKENWESDTKIGKVALKVQSSVTRDAAEVPAGKYQTLKVKIDADQSGVKVTSTYWFADQVGIVKQTFNINGTEVIVELEKFQSGK